MAELAFIKMEGAGNDYVFVDAIDTEFDPERGPAVARQVADRHFGVGGDGLIVLAPSSVADVRMLMWNADGSRGSMCGNGVRCVAKLAHDLGVVNTGNLRVETDSGVKDIELVFDADGAVIGARVEMGTVTVEPDPVRVDIAGTSVDYHPADAGNPHAVIFVAEDPATCPVAEIGGAMQTAAGVAGGVNVEFVQVQSDGSLVQRTFERGSGETMACGSGATAAACAALDLGLVKGPDVAVRLLGGTLMIRRDGVRATMEGPARTVFSGRIELAGA